MIKNIINKISKYFQKIKKGQYYPRVIKVSSYNVLKKIQKENPEATIDITDLPKNTDGKDIQDYSLHNLNVEIDLRKIWVPYDRESIYWHQKPRETFIHLQHTNLQGNHVTGNLSPRYGKGPNGEDLGRAFFWYSEETFDKEYKENNPEYFLDEGAPPELKDKFYNPKIQLPLENKLTETEKEKDVFLERQTLTFKEYIKYYKFLRGKYLGNFKITKKERVEIAFVDYFGIERARKIAEKFSVIDLPLDAVLDLLKNTDVEKWGRKNTNEQEEDLENKLIRKQK